MFADADVRATFFVLGWVAERDPSIVRRIAAAGHEIASHGYGHRLVYDQTPDEFRDDVRRSKAAIEAGLRPARPRLPRPELLDHRALALGPRRADRGRLRLRRQHLPDPSRPLRHPRCAPCTVLGRARRVRLDRGAGLQAAAVARGRRWRGFSPRGSSKSPAPPSASGQQLPHRRRRLLPPPAVLVDAPGHPAPERRGEAGRRSSTCTLGRSTRTSRG